MAHLNMQLFLLKFFKLYAIVIKKYTEKMTIYHTSITSTGGGGALNLIPHPQHLLAVPGLPCLKRTKPPHSR